MTDIEIFNYFNNNNIDIYQFYIKYESFNNNIYIDSSSDDE